eukprot:scaffold26402_cov81-Skeletonema_marinoi.AAC.3
MCCVSYGITDSDSGNANLKKSAMISFSLNIAVMSAIRIIDLSQEAVCKETVAELRDEMLFKQPESSHEGDCPICCLPHSINSDKATLICVRERRGCIMCVYSVVSRGQQQRKTTTCKSRKGLQRMIRSRYTRWHGSTTKKTITTLHLIIGQRPLNWAMHPHYNLSHLYREGEGVEKDENRGLYHLVEAAIAGHPNARYNLAVNEERNGRCDRSIKHFIIAANLGHDGSIQALKGCYKHGDVSKEDFAGALRAHYAAVNATKSPQRGAAEKYLAQNAHRIVYN